MSASDDRVASTLAEIRQNHADSEAARGLHDLSDRADVFYSSVMDVPPLLAALEAVLKAADRWQQFAADGDAQDECARELREDIATALSGPATVEDVVAASIEQQSAYRNELRHLPGYMSSEENRDV